MHAYAISMPMKLACICTCVCDTAAHSGKQMDLLGLPSNVQRRIALLLEQKPDQAPAGTTVTVFPAPDHASVGTSVPNERGVRFTEPSTIWKLSVSAEKVASQLRQNTANAVYTRAFGDHALEARHILQLVQLVIACLSTLFGHASRISRSKASCRAAEQKLNKSCSKQLMLVWVAANLCRSGRTLRQAKRLLRLVTCTVLCE